MRKGPRRSQAGSTFDASRLAGCSANEDYPSVRAHRARTIGRSARSARRCGRSEAVHCPARRPGLLRYARNDGACGDAGGTSIGPSSAGYAISPTHPWSEERADALAAQLVHMPRMSRWHTCRRRSRFGNYALKKDRLFGRGVSEHAGLAFDERRATGKRIFNTPPSPWRDRPPAPRGCRIAHRQGRSICSCEPRFHDQADLLPSAVIA